MSKNEIGSVCVAVIISLALLWGIGYTKAVNDQRFYDIIGSHMSEEGFEDWMTMEVPKGHSDG